MRKSPVACKPSERCVNDHWFGALAEAQPLVEPGRGNNENVRGRGTDFRASQIPPVDHDTITRFGGTSSAMLGIAKVFGAAQQQLGRYEPLLDPRYGVTPFCPASVGNGESVRPLR